MTTDHNEAMSQHDRDSRELRELCAQRDAARETVRKQAERIAELEAAQAGIIQAITDPENQPSQYGTVTLDYLSDKLREWERRYAKRDEQADKAAAERDTLRAEVERLKPNAERYEWLRSEHERHDPVCHLSWKLNNDRNSSEWVNTAQLDAAIDTARKATP